MAGSCPSCGAPAVTGQRFCGACGAPAAPAPQPTPVPQAAPPRKRRGLAIGLAALGVVAVGGGGAFIALRGGGGGSSGGAAGGGAAADAGIPEPTDQIAIHDAPDGVTATRIADLSTLPQLGEGGELVAAGAFGPDGSEFPAGLIVSFPLASPRTPGEALSIVALDPISHRWSGTGETATVSPSGKSARGRVPHFSTVALTPNQMESRCVTVHDTTKQDMAQANYDRLLAVNYKRQAGLMDLRPSDDLAEIMAGAASMTREFGRRIAEDRKRDVLEEVTNPLVEQATAAAKELLDPKKLAEKSFGVYDYVLEQTVQDLKVASTPQSLAAKVADWKTQARAAIGTALRAKDKAGLDAGKTAAKKLTDTSASWQAVKNDLERSQKSVERSKAGLATIKDMIDITAAAQSTENVGYYPAVASAMVSALKRWNKDLLDEAKDTLVAKSLDLDRAVSRFKVEGQRVRGKDAAALRQGLSTLSSAYDAEAQAKGQLDSKVKLETWFGAAVKALGHMKTVEETIAELRRQSDALGARSKQVAMSRDMQLWERFFAGAATLLKPLLVLVEGTAVAPIAAGYVEILGGMAELPSSLTRLVDAANHGVAAGDTADGFYLPSDPYWDGRRWVWGVRVGWNQDDSTFAVPAHVAGPFKDVIVLKADQMEMLGHAASTFATLTARNPTQDEFRQIARSVVDGTSVSFAFHDFNRDKLAFGGTRDFKQTGAAQLAGDERMWADRQLGFMLRRYQDISRVLGHEGRAEIPLASIVSLEDSAAIKTAQKAFARHNAIWNRVEDPWREAYGTPLSPDVFAAVEAGAGAKNDITGIEKKLAEKVERVRAEPGIKIPVVLARRTAWDRVDLEMVYAVHRRFSYTDACAHFRVKVGKLPWVPLDPKGHLDRHDAGGRAIASLRGISPDAYDGQPVLVEATVDVKGESVTAKTELALDPLVRIDDLEVLPKRLEPERPAAVWITAFVDDVLKDGEKPTVRVRLENLGENKEKVELTVPDADVQFAAEHTMQAIVWIDKMPKWKGDKWTGTATVTLDYGGPLKWERSVPIGAEPAAVDWEKLIQTMANSRGWDGGVQKHDPPGSTGPNPLMPRVLYGTEGKCKKPRAWCWITVTIFDNAEQAQKNWEFHVTGHKAHHGRGGGQVRELEIEGMAAIFAHTPDTTGPMTEYESEILLGQGIGHVRWSAPIEEAGADDHADLEAVTRLMGRTYLELLEAK